MQFQFLAAIVLVFLFSPFAKAGPGANQCKKYLTRAKTCLGGVAVCEQLCQKGYKDACKFLACIFETGDGVSIDAKKAFHFANVLCEQGEGASCKTLSAFYERGFGEKANKLLSHEYLLRACDLKNADSCYTLGARYLHGTFGYAEDPSRAHAYLTKSCEYSPRQCGLLAKLYEQGEGVKKNVRTALDLRLKACQTGGAWVSDDCLRAGQLHLLGASGTKRLESASRLFETSCKEGNQEACIELALMLRYDNKQGSTKQGVAMLEEICRTSNREETKALACLLNKVFNPR